MPSDKNQKRNKPETSGGGSGGGVLSMINGLLDGIDVPSDSDGENENEDENDNENGRKFTRSGGGGIMANKLHEKHNNNNNTMDADFVDFSSIGATASAAASSIAGSASIDRRDDFLQALEESLEWSNCTSGMVASFTLPLAASTGSEEEEEELVPSDMPQYPGRLGGRPDALSRFSRAAKFNPAGKEGAEFATSLGGQYYLGLGDKSSRGDPHPNRVQHEGTMENNATNRIAQVTNPRNATIITDAPHISRNISRSSLTGLPATIATIESTISSSQQRQQQLQQQRQQMEVQTPVARVQIPTPSPSSPNHTHSLQAEFSSEGRSSPATVTPPPSFDITDPDRDPDPSSNLCPGSIPNSSSFNRRRTRSNDIFRPPSRSSSPSPILSSTHSSASNASSSPNRTSPSRNHRKTFPLQHPQPNIDSIGHQNPYFHVMPTPSTTTASCHPNRGKSHRKTKSYSGGEPLPPKLFAMIDLRHRPQRKTYNHDTSNNNITGNSHSRGNSPSSPPPLPPMETTAIPRLEDSRRPSSMDNTTREISFSSVTSATSSASSASTVMASNNFHDMSNGSGAVIDQDGLLVVPPPPSTPAISLSSGEGSCSPHAMSPLEQRPMVPGDVVPSISVDFREEIGNERLVNHAVDWSREMERMNHGGGDVHGDIWSADFDDLGHDSGSSLESLGMHSFSSPGQNNDSNCDGHDDGNGEVEILSKTNPMESLSSSFPSSDDLSTSDRTSRVKNKKKESKVVLHRSSSTGSISSSNGAKYFKKNNLVILPTPAMNENGQYGYHPQRNKVYDKESSSNHRHHPRHQQQPQQEPHPRHAKPTLQKSTLHPSLPPPHPLKHVQSDPQQLLTTVNSSSSNSSNNTHIHSNGNQYYHNYWETDSTASTPKTSPARHRTCSSLSSVDIGESGILSVTVAELNAKLNAELEHYCGGSDGGYWYDGNDDYNHRRDVGGAREKGLVDEGFAGDGSNYDGFGSSSKGEAAITADGTSVDDFSYSDDGTDSDQMGQIGSGLDGRVSWVDNDDDDDDRNSKPMQSFSIPSFIQDFVLRQTSLDAKSSVDAGEMTLTRTPVKAINLTPPASPNPNLRNIMYDNSKWHRQQPSFVSAGSAAHRSQNSLESMNSLSYSQASVGMPSIPSTPNTPYDGPLSPDSELFGLTSTPEPKNTRSSSDSNNIRGTKFPPLFKGDSFFEDERLFVQEIHNSGLQSNSFEHVEDSIPSDEVDLNELDYDVGENGVEVGIGKTHERREMERRMIQIYRQIRALGRKKKRQLQNDNDSNDAGNECFDENGMELTPLVGREDGFSSATPRTSNGSGNGYFESSKETKCQPGDSPSSWSDLIFLRMNWLNLLWQWNHQPFSNQTSNSSTHIELSSLRRGDEDDECRHISPTRSLFQSSPSSPFSILASNSLFSFNTKHKLKHSNVDDYDYNSRGYDDIDFDRSANTICSICRRIYCTICGCGGTAGYPYNLQSCLWFLQTRKKLLLISVLFLIFAWVFSGGRLTKHHIGDENDDSRYYYGYGLLSTDPDNPNFYGFFPSDDALGRNNFVDDDGYFEHNPMMSPEDDDVDASYTTSTFSKKERLRDHNSPLVAPTTNDDDDHITEESTIQDKTLHYVGGVSLDGINPTDDFFENYKTIETQGAVDSESDEQFIALNQIDTIVVVGERHSGILWLVDKLRLLYPDLAVFNGFPKDGKVVRDGWWFQDFDETKRRRSTSLTNDTSSSNADLLHFRRRAENTHPHSTTPYIKDQKNDSIDSTPDYSHMLVIAVFVNPYDYIELMRVDPFNAPRHEGMKWKEFVEAEWSPYYGADNSADIWEDDDDDDFDSMNKDRYTDGDINLDGLNGSIRTEHGDDNDDDDGDWDNGVTDKGASDSQNSRNLLLPQWRLLHMWMGFVESSSEEDSGCQLSFGPTRVLPCWHTNDGKTASSSAAINELEKHIPVYETRLDGSGTPYESILQLRADKIRSAITDSKKHPEVGFVIPVKYETLIDGYSDGTFTNFPGIVGLMNRIESLTGMLPDKGAGWTEMSKNENKFWADPIGCRGHICSPSVNAMRKNAEYIQYMNDHVDWEAESLVGYQKWPLPKPSVDQIVVLGERHSGAEWLVEKLSLCFPSIQVKWGFTRPGKWFQEPPSYSLPSTLVIVVSLNVYDWMELMRQNPINAPAHKDMDWAEFVTSEWTRKRSGLDHEIADPSSVQCSFGFSYEEVVPCLTQRDPDSDSFPLYELRHPSKNYKPNRPYSNLLQLRSDKIQNFLHCANFDGVVDLITLRYEDLVWNGGVTDDDITYLTLPFPGIAGLLEKIRDRTTLIPDASAGWIVDEYGIFRAEPLGVGVMNLDPYYVQWVEDHADWDVEHRIGYGK